MNSANGWGVVCLSNDSDGGKVTIQVIANSGEGSDLSWLRNAVEEPFDEAGIDTEIS